MKTNDLLLYGGIGLAAYYLVIKPKQQAAVTPVAVAPGSGVPVTALPPATSTTNNLLTSITNAVKNLTSGGTTPTVQPVLTASGITSVDTSLQTTNTPVVSDAQYLMFENNDYPGALAGFIEEEVWQ